MSGTRNGHAGVAAVTLAVACLIGCGGTASSSPAPPSSSPVPPAATTAAASLPVSSADLAAGNFSADLTCDGADRPPAVTFGPVAAGTGAVVIDLVDPDAPGGTFTHWLLVGDHPAAAGQTIAASVPAGFVAGTDDFGVTGYRGPCPPRGSVHHYHLRVRALARPLGLQPGFSVADLGRAVAAATVLQSGEVVATYARR
jgi:Raf kinase inhibitor-like YbhB/YbcL family protein